MFSGNEINGFFDAFVQNSEAFSAAKRARLETFRGTEASLKSYVDALGELEKQQNRVSFSEFSTLQAQMIKHLKQFNPKNVSGEIKKVNQYTQSLTYKGKEFKEVAGGFSALDTMWKSFLTRNPSFVDTNFDNYYKKELEAIVEKITNIHSSDLDTIASLISIAHVQFEKIMIQIEKIKEYTERYIYIGEAAQQLLLKLSDLMQNSDNYDVKEFFEVASVTLDKIDAVILESKTARVPVPVVKVYNARNPKVYKYTLRFGDRTVLYENFFEDRKYHPDDADWRTNLIVKNQDDNEDEAEFMKHEETGRFVYLDNFPLDGIFSGREIVENLEVSKEYQIEVEELSSKAFTTFVLTFFFLTMLTLVCMLIGKTAIFIDMMIIAASLLGYKAFLSNIKLYGENKRNMPAYFTFTKIDFIFTKEGDDFYIDEALLGAIKDFDNTILNEKFHKALERNIKYVVVNEKRNKGE